jgi:hypothetical protein
VDGEAEASVEGEVNSPQLGADKRRSGSAANERERTRIVFFEILTLN